MLEHVDSDSGEAFFTSLSRDDETIIRQRRFRRLRVIRSQLTRFQDWGLVTGSSVWLQACFKLSDLSGINPSRLQIESCSRLDLSTISQISRLTHLNLIGAQKRIDGFDFVVNCPRLKVLSVTALKPMKNNFDGIVRSTSLRFVTIMPAANQTILDIGAQNLRILVSNGMVTVDRGTVFEAGLARWQKEETKHGWTP